MRLAYLIAALAIIDNVCCFQPATAVAQEIQAEKALGLAVEQWKRYGSWEGPSQKSVRFQFQYESNQPGQLRDRVRCVDGAYFLSHFQYNHNGKQDMPTVAIRNPTYAAWMTKGSNGWLLKGMAYQGSEQYDNYVPEAVAPWMIPLRLPGQGMIVDAIAEKRLVLDGVEPVASATHLDANGGPIYRFAFSIHELEFGMHGWHVEIDASPELDWFPLRMHRDSGKGKFSSLTLSEFTKCDGFFVPARREDLNESGKKGEIRCELIVGEPTKLDPKECYLEFYGLGDLQLPKKRGMRFDWITISVCIVAVIVVVGFVFKMRNWKQA